jgi:hypothetical protein
MINPQENPHLLTQDYFQELLEKIYPGMKVNDIIPFHHQGQAVKMINNRSIYYGYWTFPCSTQSSGLSKIKVAGQPDKLVLGPFPNDGITVGLAFDYSWFGMASYIEHSASLNAIGMTFSGFRATFDNTPSPPVNPTPQPPIGQYRIANLTDGMIGPTTKRYQFNIAGVPNSTVHFKMNGLAGAVVGDPHYTVRNSDLEVQFGGTFLALVGIDPAFPVDFVTLDAFGDAVFYVDMGDATTEIAANFSIDITGATAGTPTGTQVGSIELP